MTEPVAMDEMSRNFVSSRKLREPLVILLSARPGGLCEPMLLALVLAGDSPLTPLAKYAAAGSTAHATPALRKMRQTLRRMGARQDGQGRWAAR